MDCDFCLIIIAPLMACCKHSRWPSDGAGGCNKWLSYYTNERESYLKVKISQRYELQFSQPFFFLLICQNTETLLNLSLLFHNRRLHREQNFIVALISGPDGSAEYKTLYPSHNDLSLGTTHLTPPAELVGGKQ